MPDNNLFTGYTVGSSEPVTVSHLQFADDTLILGNKSRANIRAMRAVLLLFENLSGLKSQLVGVNVTTSWLLEAKIVLSCKVGYVPFVYMGLPIGGNARHLAFGNLMCFPSEVLINCKLRNRLVFLRCGDNSLE